MSWEQHRYAVERAAAYRRKLADDQNEICGGVNLQGEANGSDAEMLLEVAEFLQSLEGSKAGDILENPGAAFIADWNKMVATVSNLAGMYDLPKPVMVFHPKWNQLMRQISLSPISDTIIYAGIMIRFGTLEQVTAIR